MNPVERRKKILDILQKGDTPVSAGKLAKMLGVSRQVIVGDVALLRAANQPITATPRGYLLENENARPGELIRTIACRHDRDGIKRELYAVVDNGCGVLDVIVEHAVYGQISGRLQVFSRFDVDDFLRRLEKSRSLPLCNLTDGVHLHMISCPNEDAYRRVIKQLKQEAILFERE